MLMEARTKVILLELSRPLELIKQFIYYLKWALIIYGHFVQLVLVNNKAPKEKIVDWIKSFSNKPFNSSFNSFNLDGAILQGGINIHS